MDDKNKVNINMTTTRLSQRCPKCGGNLFLYYDYNGWYEQCLQCSFILYLDEIYSGKNGAGSSKTSEISQVRYLKRK